jgi:hypothetical protein
MIYDQALNIFPTEIWEMIVYYLFESDFQTFDFDSRRVCQTIGLPFTPMINRMMNRYLPKLQSRGLQSLQRDFIRPNLEYKPLYNSFYLQTDFVCRNLSYQLPNNFYDNLMDRFLEKIPKCSFAESRFHFENVMDIYVRVFGEASDIDSDTDSDNEKEDSDSDFKLWFTFVYAMLAARIVPLQVLAYLEMKVYRMILN